MTRIALLALLSAAVLGGCAPPAATRSVPAAMDPAPDLVDPYAACRSLEVQEPCFRATEQRLLDATGGRVVRDGPRLTFNPPQGAPVTLYDDTSDPGVFSLHRYLGFVPRIGYHLVRIGYFGSNAFFLVSGRTAAHENIPALPIVSPDTRRLLSASMDPAGGYVPNRIEIWLVRPDRLEKEWETIADAGDEDDPWFASEARWIDGETIDFVRNQGKGPGCRRTRMRLRRVGGEWTLRETGPAPPNDSGRGGV